MIYLENMSRELPSHYLYYDTTCRGILIDALSTRNMTEPWFRVEFQLIILRLCLGLVTYLRLHLYFWYHVGLVFISKSISLSLLAHKLFTLPISEDFLLADGYKGVSDFWALCPRKSGCSSLDLQFVSECWGCGLLIIPLVVVSCTGHFIPAGWSYSCTTVCKFLIYFLPPTGVKICDGVTDYGQTICKKAQKWWDKTDLRLYWALWEAKWNSGWNRGLA